MIKSSIYKYLVEELATKIEKDFADSTPRGKSTNTYKYFGTYHKAIYFPAVALLSDQFRKFLCDPEKPLLRVDEEGCLFAFDGRCYNNVGVGTQFLTELINRTMRRLEIARQYIIAAPPTITKEIHRTLTASDEYEFRPDRRYIVFNNGVFDVEQGVLRDFDMKYSSDIVLDFDFMTMKELDKHCADKFGVNRELNPVKLWEWKIEEIIPSDDFRDAFQQWCGGVLRDRTKWKMEYVCFLLGSGSNGKSVLASVVAGVFGDEYFSRFSPRQLFKDSDARVNIASLRHKLANFVGDLDEKDISGGDFKRFASGEIFQGRENYAKASIQVAAPPLLCCANSIPDSRDDTHGGFRRRLVIRTTTRQWTEEDKDPYLVYKLTVPEARMRVFWWMYDGYKKIVKNGGNIILGAEVKEAMSELEKSSNSLRRWWEYVGYCKPKGNVGEWQYFSDISKSYQAYCKEFGEPNPEPPKKLGALLKSKGITKKRKVGGYTQYLIAYEEDFKK